MLGSLSLSLSTMFNFVFAFFLFTGLPGLERADKYLVFAVPYVACGLSLWMYLRMYVSKDQ